MSAASTMASSRRVKGSLLIVFGVLLYAIVLPELFAGKYDSAVAGPLKPKSGRAVFGDEHYW